MFINSLYKAKIVNRVNHIKRSFVALVVITQYLFLLCVGSLNAQQRGLMNQSQDDERSLMMDNSAIQDAYLGRSNNTSVFNVSTPSRAGVSRNYFQDFNVNQAGLIINNSIYGGDSSLSGEYVSGNSNLFGGTARIVLSEVTGSNASSLRGGVEMLGQRAEFILANSLGIDCDGCSFMNMSRVALTTGQVLLGTDRTKVILMLLREYSQV